ncbi:MAG TPA: hypothetical protein VKD91_17315 [Pyrinomonadaceae bacterium]|nr:hypothetical protein [Pyrinomonadaceae bacterium]
MRSRLVAQVCLPPLFLAAALLAFATNLTSYFLSDDFVQIGNVLHGDFSPVWGQSHGGFFRPLFILSYIIDTRVWHERALGYHLTNITIHALNSFCVFRLGLRLFAKLKLPARSGKAAAGAAAALFLLHPSHTEAVIWISGRADLIATLFCLLSLWCYCVFVQGPGRAWLALALVLGTAALLAKESAVCLPFLILALGLFFSRRKKAFADAGLFVIVLLAFILVRAYFLGVFLGGYGARQHLNFAPGWIRDRLLEAIVRSFLPALPAAWSFFLFKPLQSPLFFIIALAVFTLIAGAIIIRRRLYDASQRESQNRFLLLLASLFLISLLPVINLRLSLYQPLGERFLYLPTVWSALAIGCVLTILARRPKVWLLLLICVLGFYSWRLYAANQSWREAAQLARSIRDAFSNSASPRRLTILNVPDNLRGVPVFHNGLPEALQFFASRQQFERVETNAFQTLQSTGDLVTVRQAAGALTLEPVAHGDTFDRPSSSECLELLSQSAGGLTFKPQPCFNPGEVYFFSGGKMQEIVGQ